MPHGGVSDLRVDHDGPVVKYIIGAIVGFITAITLYWVSEEFTGE